MTLTIVGKMDGSTPVALAEPEHVSRAIDGDVVDLGDGRVAYVKHGHLWFDLTPYQRGVLVGAAGIKAIAPDVAQ
jgi:hypothetical protein